MACKNTYTLALERVPDVASPVIIAAEQDTAGDGESDGGDTAQYVVVRVDVELAVGTDVEQAARRIIRASCKGITIGEESTVGSETMRTDHRATGALSLLTRQR